VLFLSRKNRQAPANGVHFLLIAAICSNRDNEQQDEHNDLIQTTSKALSPVPIHYMRKRKDPAT